MNAGPGPQMGRTTAAVGRARARHRHPYARTSCGLRVVTTSSACCVPAEPPRYNWLGADRFSPVQPGNRSLPEYGSGVRRRRERPRQTELVVGQLPPCRPGAAVSRRRQAVRALIRMARQDSDHWRQPSSRWRDSSPATRTGPAAAPKSFRMRLPPGGPSVRICPATSCRPVRALLRHRRTGPGRRPVPADSTDPDRPIEGVVADDVWISAAARARSPSRWWRWRRPRRWRRHARWIAASFLAWCTRPWLLSVGRGIRTHPSGGVAGASVRAASAEEGRWSPRAADAARSRSGGPMSGTERWEVAPDAGCPEGRACSHLDLMEQSGAPGAAPSAGCRGCAPHGAPWVRLRQCVTCGYVGCCDSSPGRHSYGHHERSGHPVAVSLAPDEDWAWCFPDEVFLVRARPDAASRQQVGRATDGRPSWERTARTRRVRIQWGTTRTRLGSSPTPGTSWCGIQASRHPGIQASSHAAGRLPASCPSPGDQPPAGVQRTAGRLGHTGRAASRPRA
ncbi:UBP-type zinc finger domain-containing protein [Streptomyces sp. NPDC085540]|uniref:UBP-type zinc finger domain-containing protein n=1 Tax=Streptomyces sp. NPDC085540 TaxID=3365730 RepID=UPI0037D27B41